MKYYDVWMEGFQVMEGSCNAKYLGTYSGNSFKEACKKAAKAHPNYGNYDARRNTIWGCKLFQSEAAARRSFG